MMRWYWCIVLGLLGATFWHFIIRFIFVLVIVALVTPAMAKAVTGIEPPSRVSRLVAAAVPKTVTKDTSDIPILLQIQADAAAALADAQANQDVIAATCYAAIGQVAEARIAAAQTPNGGLLTVFQKLRDISRLNASPLGTQLIVGCAPLVQDAKLNLVQFFTQIGGLILLKGIIPIP